MVSIGIAVVTFLITSDRFSPGKAFLSETSSNIIQASDLLYRISKKIDHYY